MTTIPSAPNEAQLCLIKTEMSSSWTSFVRVLGGRMAHMSVLRSLHEHV